MNAYKYIKTSFQNEYKERSPELRAKITNWRREEAVSRIDRPTNIARARELGYKAKNGVMIARVKVRRGLSKRQKPANGRKPSKSGRYFAYRKSLQAIAEERAASRFMNCEVVNSYFVGQDAEYKFFEAILVDRNHPEIMSDRNYQGIIAGRGRAFRGLTSQGTKHRGIVEKGFGTSKNRPSIRSRQRNILRV